MHDKWHIFYINIHLWNIWIHEFPRVLNPGACGPDFVLIILRHENLFKIEFIFLCEIAYGGMRRIRCRNISILYCRVDINTLRNLLVNSCHPLNEFRLIKVKGILTVLFLLLNFRMQRSHNSDNFNIWGPSILESLLTFYIHLQKSHKIVKSFRRIFFQYLFRAMKHMYTRCIIYWKWKQ